MDKLRQAVVMSALLLSPGVAWSHSGGVNADGCHTERETGEHHCHPMRARVVDGDTIRAIMASGNAVTVRLYGIDAPEGRQSGGAASAAALRALLAGQRLAVVPYGRDRYGRTLAVVYATALGKTTVNQAMLDGGHAWHFGQYCTEGFCAAWKRSEQCARQARRGLWSKPNPIPPWDWRARGN